MRAPFRFCFCLLGCSAPAAVFASDSTPVVTVGSATLGPEALGERLRTLPRYQLDSLGANADEIRRAFVDQVVVPELLFGEEAKRRKLDETLPGRIATREVLRGALQRELRAELAKNDPVTDHEVAEYYEKHAKEYEKPLRIRLFRILTDSESDAKSVLEQAQHADLAKWRELARKHSSDAATRERGGDLGFVHPDGQTDVPRVRVDAALYQAALKVENGALVPDPISEGDQFAVVWRRGSLDASDGGLEAHRSRIARLLEEDRLRLAIAKVAERQQGVARSNLTLLEELALPAFGADERAGEVRIEGRPGAAPRPSTSATPEGVR